METNNKNMVRFHLIFVVDDTRTTDFDVDGDLWVSLEMIEGMDDLSDIRKRLEDEIKQSLINYFESYGVHIKVYNQQEWIDKWTKGVSK